ncbi:cation diffusion facilitator family transporter [Oricola sp.]|uniref:cation diffusion facilitator family transporter n=1 Tax=Oricola sp. TaxID=1979950 RepID=UPI0025DB77DD|nr:cation diffusion facilitator family transporter [Oricola sp.]MCI5074411.1 cation diffusion facilitator family transporter [Oricola sp.]
MTEFDPAVKRLATWSIAVAIGVMGLKLVAWYVTGSVALLSDGLESTVNVIAAVIALAAITYAQRPADADHQFGHHKAEYFSAVLEGVLIVVAALLIVQQAVGALANPALPAAPGLGLAINLFASAINGVWAYLLIRVGRQKRSPALVADGHHIFSDVVTSIGVFIGLVLALVTGYAILDPLLAIAVAINILWQGWKVISTSVNALMDRAVEPADEVRIKEIIAANAEGSIDVHDLRTRVAGPATFIDFHLVVPKTMSVGAAHEICDRLEDAIRDFVPGASIAIHVEPQGEKAHGIRVRI